MRIPLRVNPRAVLFAAIVISTISYIVTGQTVNENPPKPKPIKFDEIGPIGDCELATRFDRFQRELSNVPNYQGYVINYASSSSSSEEGIANRERIFTDRVALRNYDRSRITLVRGGFRLDEATELWLLPRGSELPAPLNTVSAPPTSENSTLLYASNYLEYYLDDWSKDLLLESVRRRDSSDESPETAKPESVDHRYRWADPGLAVRVANSKGSTGVILFYADDTRYDIRKLRPLIENGVQRMIVQAPLAKSRLRIEFGGYRNTPAADLWFVPEGGKAPKPRPSERCTQ